MKNKKPKQHHRDRNNLKSKQQIKFFPK